MGQTVLLGLLGDTGSPPSMAFRCVVHELLLSVVKAPTAQRKLS